jgi:predicted ATPase
LEDLHWADSASLDLLNDLVTEQQNIPFLLIGLARPMLFERRPTWGSGQSFHKRITLEPLDKRESRELAREILQKVADPPKELRDLLVERAEGNPFYMEELVKMLIEDRVVVKGDNKWTAEPSRLAHVRVPTTLVGLLQARLDTLLYPEKLALQRAAVMGRVFYDGALRALDAHDETTLRDLDGILKNLTERGFVYRRETSAFAGNVEYIFSQAMLREAVYETLLRRQLRAYHAGVAEWLGKASGERRGEYLPLIAEHYEKADENEKAAAALREAGDRALILSAFADAKGFFERALTLSEAEKGPRAEVAELECKLGEAHHRLSDFATAQSHTETALTFARQLNSDILVATALAQLGALASDLGDYARVETYLTEALPLARAGDDPETLARVLYGLGDLNWRRGGFDAAHSYLNESLTIARATGNTTRELYALNRMAAVTINQNELGEAERLLKEVHTLALAAGNRERAMTALNNLGVVADIRGDFAAVYDYAQQALALARELGAPQNIALYLINLGEVSIKRGDRGAARKQLREGLSLAQQLGARPTAVSAVMYFARLAATEHDTPRALALLGMTQRDPSFTADNRRNLEQMLAEWALDPAVVEAGLAKGAELSWDEVIKELLKEDVTRSY